MNDRIHELGKQAAAETSKEVVYLNNIHEWQLVFEQKFAELIVAECLKIAKNREDELESAGLLEESNAVGNVAYRISRQFGVKR
jgi:hypothetical protein